MDQNTVLIALTIDENLRTIAIPTNGVVFGVVGDVEVNRVQFVLPRYFRGFDLTEFTARVNYANPNGDANYYEADDITDTDGNCTFTWLMGSDVTAYVGDVTFSITLYKKEGDIVAHRFGTRTATGRVLEGYSVEESVTPAQQKTLVEKISEEVISNFKTDDVVAQVEKNKEDISILNESVFDIVDYYNTEDIKFTNSSGGSSLYVLVNSFRLIDKMSTYSILVDFPEGTKQRVYLFGSNKKLNTGDLICLESIDYSKPVEFILKKYDYPYYAIGVSSKSGLIRYSLREIKNSDYPQYVMAEYTNYDINPGDKIKPSVSDYFELLMHVNIKIKQNKNSNKLVHNIITDRTIIVGKDDADCTTINEALEIFKSIRYCQSPFTILINPGVYNEVCNIRGVSYGPLMLVGVDREKCIIRDDSGKYINSPLRIAGNSIVRNLSIIATANDAELVVDGIVQENTSYGVHVDDRHVDDDRDYKTVIENCYIYSEQNSAMGIGLDKNFTLCINNCELVSNISDDMIAATGHAENKAMNYKKNPGALFYHSLYKGNYTSDEGYQKLQVKNCILRNNVDNIVFSEAGGMEEQVEVEFINNTGWSDTNGATFKNNITRSTMSKISSGNNCEDMNYKA